MKAVDLSGKRFGKLTVLKKTEQKRKGSFLWLCRCDCGNEILLERYKIERELVHSCGCSRTSSIVLTGKKIGKLTVIRKLNEKKGSNYLWLCRCDCGNEIKVPTSHLTRNNPTSSCGCSKGKKSEDISNQKFGRLLAICPTEKRLAGSVVWECVCDCGNRIEVSLNQLKSGNVKSCGCLVHEHDPKESLHYVERTCVESLRSKEVRKDNTSGCTGVRKQKGKWIAQISFQKVRYFLGAFEKKEDAIFVRKQAEHLLHDSFVDAYDKWSRKDLEYKEKHPFKIVVSGSNIDDFEVKFSNEESDGLFIYRGMNEKESKQRKQDRCLVLAG
ncbi:hypothetical protein [Dubosiella newyorkensis]|uniref:hypothetical protein n=1 Tax=Dubosiella newyorkensis TaxID=1862672 RepID=UPI0023F47775|nr:hypothetical protein [Dubosiella newyorkensis]